MGILPIVASIIGIAASIYLIVVGQKGILEWWNEHITQRRLLNPTKRDKTPKLLFFANNLPPKVDFIGRELEKTQLRKELDSGHSVISIVGNAGVGKTSLILEVAYEYLEMSRQLISRKRPPQLENSSFEAFIWISAKYNEISLNDLLNTVAMVLDFPFIVRKEMSEKELEIKRLLQKHKSLILIDNLETAGQETGAILRFLFDLPMPSRAIITSRYHQIHKGRIIMLSGLQPNEGIAFIRQEAQKRDLPLVEHASEEVLLRLYNVTGGVPLAIEWAIGQIKQRGLALDQIIGSIQSARGDIFQELFERSWNSLGPPAKQILMALTVFRSPALKTAIQRISNLSSTDLLEEGLSQLIEMSLAAMSDEIEEIQTRYSIHPLTHVFATAQANKIPPFLDDAHMRAAEFFIEYAKQRNPSDVPGEKVKELDIDLNNITYLMNWCSSKKKLYLFIELSYAIEEYLLIRGFWEERIDYLKDAAVACNETGDMRRKAHFLTVIGGTLVLKGQYGSAEKMLNDALQIAREIPDESQISRALRTLALSAHRQNDNEKAKQLLEGVEELAVHAGDMHNYVDTLWLRGIIAFESNDHQQAKRVFEKMVSTSEEIHWQRAIAYGLGYLGDIARQEGNYARAKEYYDRGLVIALDFGDRRQVATLRLSESELSADVGRVSEMKNLAQDALDIFERLGMDRDTRRAQATINKVENMSSRIPLILNRFRRRRPMICL